MSNDLFNSNAPRTTGTAVAVHSPVNITGLLAGGGSFGTNRRLSIRGGVFREIVNGEEVHAYDARAVNLVIINAAPVSRTFYEGEYKEGEKVAPACWSSDGKVPDQSVPAESRQATACAKCPMNIKGSGNGDSRACRFQQRLAVMLADDGRILEDDPEVFQLSIPAVSLFGESKDGKMGLQAYARFVQSRKGDIASIVTEARLDPSSSTPKLVFKPVRPLTEDELLVVQEMAQHEDTIKAITMTVSQLDGPTEDALPPAASTAPAPTPPPAAPKAEEPAGLFGDAQPAAAAQAAPAATAPRRRPGRPSEKDKAAAAAEPIQEPTKAPTAAAPAATVPKDLKNILDDWDDE